MPGETFEIIFHFPDGTFGMYEGDEDSIAVDVLPGQVPSIGHTVSFYFQGSPTRNTWRVARVLWMYAGGEDDPSVNVFLDLLEPE